MKFILLISFIVVVSWFQNSSVKRNCDGNSTNSDITLKDNIDVIPNSLDKLLQIRGVTYNRTDIEGSHRQAGVIAQEVEKVLPELVNTYKSDLFTEDGVEHEFKTVSYDKIVGLLINAIKELNEKIDNK